MTIKCVKICLIIANALCLAVMGNEDDVPKVGKILNVLAIILLSISFLGK